MEEIVERVFSGLITLFAFAYKEGDLRGCRGCLEATWRYCGATYAMAIVEEDDEPEEICLEKLVVAEKLKEMSLLEGGLYKRRSILGFAA